MDIKFNCVCCGTHIVIDEAGAGMSVQCPNCGASLNVPKAYSVCWPDCPQNIYEQIQRSVLEGIEKGETMRELTKRVQNEFTGVDKKRAGIIAQTLSKAVSGAAHFKELKDAGYRTKRWVTSDDEDVRDSHRACERQGAIPMDKPFVNGLMYPGDPKGDAREREGCRCYLETGTDAASEADRMNDEAMDNDPEFFNPK